MEDNIILIDWFSMSFRKPGTNIYTIIDLLQLPEEAVFKQFSGRYMYKSRVSWGNIHIYYDNINSDEDYPLLEMSGQGCREFETFSQITFNDLFELAKDTANYHLTRLDIAYDDHIGIFDIKQIVSDYYKRNFVSHSMKGRITDDVSRNIDGFSVMTGTKQSDIYMRIYDKAVERGYKDGRHWVRCELVLKQDRAVQFILNKSELGEKFRGVIKNYFRFVKPSKTDSNKARWAIRDYWEKFLSDSERIKVYVPKDIDYNLSRLHRYVFSQAGNSIDTYIKCVGLLPFLDNLLKRESRLTPKQKYLIEQCSALIGAGVAVDEQVLEELSKNFRL